MAISPICNITQIAKLRTPPDSFHIWKWMTCSYKNGWKMEFVGRACSVSRHGSSLRIGKRGWPVDDFSNICSAIRKDLHLYSLTLILQILFWMTRISKESLFLSMWDHDGGIFSGSMGIWVNAQFWRKLTPLSMLIPVHSSPSLCLQSWVKFSFTQTAMAKRPNGRPYASSSSFLFRDLIPKFTNIVRQGFYIITLKVEIP